MSEEPKQNLRVKIHLTGETLQKMRLLLKSDKTLYTTVQKIKAVIIPLNHLNGACWYTSASKRE